MADPSGLLAVMTEMRRLVALPDNDFAWSAWRDHQAALADMDRAIADLTQGVVSNLSWLFAPTGPCKKSASTVDGERSSSRSWPALTPR